MVLSRTLSRTRKTQFGGRDEVKLYVRVTKPDGRRSWEAVGVIQKMGRFGPWYLSLIGDVFNKALGYRYSTEGHLPPESSFDIVINKEDFEDA